MGVKSAKVGLSNLHYAICTSDTAAGVTYEAAVLFAGSIEAKVTVESNEANEFSDNVLSDTAYGAVKVTVELTQKDVDLETQAALLGHTLNGGVLVVNGNDVAPYVAIGFEALKNNGKKRFVWLLKGKFAEIDEGAKSKTATAELQQQTLKGTFGGLEYNSDVIRKTDEDVAGYIPAVGINWYTDGPFGSADTTPPTVVCVPADNATGVAVNANVVLTFNEAINTSSLIVGESFMLQKADGTQVVGVGVWNAGNTVYTFTPAVSMSGSYEVIVTRAVKDLSGNKLASVNVFNFTTL